MEMTLFYVFIYGGVIYEKNYHINDVIKLIT